MIDALAPLRGFGDYAYDSEQHTISAAEGRLIILRSQNVRIGEAVAAALNAAVSPWQPIETAPKDGTIVLVYDGTITSAYCEHGDIWWEQYDSHSLRPTHWMPLPPPPEGT